MPGIIAVVLLGAWGAAGIAAAFWVSWRHVPRGKRTLAAAHVHHRSARFERELTALMDRGIAELVGERLRAGPMLVPVSMGHHPFGPWMDVDLGRECLRLRLNRVARRPAPALAGTRLARLRALSFIEGEGWQIVFDGPRGPQRYVGWLIESLDARAAPAA